MKANGETEKFHQELEFQGRSIFNSKDYYFMDESQKLLWEE